MPLHHRCEIYCDERIAESILAVATRLDIEVLLSVIVLDRSAGDLAIDLRFPQLKSIKIPVTGHKSRRLYQFIVLEGCDGADYIFGARDLGWKDPVSSLDDFDPEQLHALRVAAGVAVI